jgi:hypothetical protein
LHDLGVSLATLRWFITSQELFMKPLSRPELALLLALLAALALACLGPNVAQHAHYHAFADQRGWHGLPCALDVLSNLPFAVAGTWGLARAWQARGAVVWDARWALASVFFVGLLVTAVGSSYYHLQPDNNGLAWDRLGMVVAFAGVLGMAAADRISLRAGVALVWATLVAGPLAVLVWHQWGNLLPWVVVQGGGMLLALALALRQPVRGGWGLPLVAVIALYVLAKLLELGDHAVFEVTQGVVSGHSLKHIVAALAAWPVLGVMHKHVPWMVSKKYQLEIPKI